MVDDPRTESILALLWLIPLAPAIGGLIAGVLQLTGRGKSAAPAFSLLGTAASTAMILVARPGALMKPSFKSYDWLNIPGFYIPLGINLDHLAWVMTVVVVIVSALVQIYSIGYMKGEVGYARYFAYLGLFTSSMLGLVVADNLFQLYVCWELVGICSYLLIGFWWHKKSAADAAKKAFVVTRFGDMGFLLGVLLLAAAAHSFRMADVTRAVTSGAGTAFVPGQVMVWLAPLLLFCGAVGKSAQFPLHVWLPDAMEGPTPVSALIHAATMVAAGVYMVARLSGIFAASAVALDVVLLIGAVTAFIAATIALVQYDIKKVLAYSTISQLGYMMIGLGVGEAGRTAGMFHLVTHAFFKALLFLAAGSVIHAMHHAADPNDMRGMGGLGKRMRQTALTCGIGVLALAGLPPFSGFFSKDAILGAALDRMGGHGAGADTWAAGLGLAIGLAVAGITAFYSVRMWLLTFHGEPRSHDAEHAHESPAVMTGPLILLAIPSIFLGGYLELSGSFAAYMGEAEAASHWGLAGVAAVIAFLCAALAWRLYAKPAAEADPVTKMPRPLYNTFANLWYMDAFWTNVGAGGSLALGRTVAWFDRNIIDGAMNGIGWLTGRCGAVLRRFTNGQAQAYAGALVAAALLLAVALMLLSGGMKPPAGGPVANGPSDRRTDRQVSVRRTIGGETAQSSQRDLAAQRTALRLPGISYARPSGVRQ